MYLAPDTINDQLLAAPNKPGVYLFRDSSANFLYVGKASNLRQRVRSYFRKQDRLSPKIRRLVQRVTNLEFLITQTESEALILENTLIKRHRPAFNSRLLDDKTYPYIKIDLKEDFPLVSFTRRVSNDGARYFGPFANTGSVRKTMNLLKKLFPYRSCTKQITGADPRPCLEYYIHRCIAPCAGYATKEEYQDIIRQVILFMEGKSRQVIEQVTSNMESAASSLQFERAAILRDQIRAIRQVHEEQNVVSIKTDSMDILAMVRESSEACVEVFFIRNGKLIGRDHFTMIGIQEDCPGTILSNFVKQFYGQTSFIPPRILVEYPIDDIESIQTWLTNRRGSRVNLQTPKRGKNRKLITMAKENAAQQLLAIQQRRITNLDFLTSAQTDLQEALNLPRPPKRIECYDISNTSGTDPVGSMVVFENGKPKPAHYRRFKIKKVGSIDDYSMMREMVTRRFKKLGEKDFESLQPEAMGNNPIDALPTSWGLIPDLVLIDGGKGHLSAVHGVFLELGISTEMISLASIAKRQEDIFVPQVAEPVVLQKDTHGLHLLQQIRDEAHRFAINYHRNLRSKRAVKSKLDLIHGIGPKKRKLLIHRFGSLDKVKAASIHELMLIPGLTKGLAERIKSGG